MIIHGKAVLGRFPSPSFNATAAFLVMWDVHGSPNLIFSPVPPHSYRDWNLTPLLSSHQVVVRDTQSSCWRLRNSDCLARSPIALSFTTAGDPAASHFTAETQLFHLFPHLLF